MFLFVYPVNGIALCLRACVHVDLTRHFDIRLSKDRRTDLVPDSSVLARWRAGALITWRARELTIWLM